MTPFLGKIYAFALPLKMGNLLFITSFPWQCCWHCFILDFRFLECQMSMWRNWERSIKLEALIGKLNHLLAWFQEFYFLLEKPCVVEEKNGCVSRLQKFLIQPNFGIFSLTLEHPRVTGIPFLHTSSSLIDQTFRCWE